MKRFSSTALLAAALLAVSSAAVAAPPPVRPNFTPPPVPAGEGCAFELGITGTDAKARIKTFKNGKQIISGKGFLLTYTNRDSGESVTFQTNGTAEVTSAPDANNVVTVTATGSNGLVLFSSDASNVPGVGHPSAIQYTGRIVYTVDLDNGFFTLISASGPRRDLCAELS
jgi:opacity protein-like surface antigen